MSAERHVYWASARRQRLLPLRRSLQRAWPPLWDYSESALLARRRRVRPREWSVPRR